MSESTDTRQLLSLPGRGWERGRLEKVSTLDVDCEEDDVENDAGDFEVVLINGHLVDHWRQAIRNMLSSSPHRHSLLFS